LLDSLLQENQLWFAMTQVFLCKTEINAKV